MTALQADTAAHGDADFRHRVEYWTIAAAIAITTESATGVAQHSDRLLLAQRVLGNPDRYVVAFAVAALTTLTLANYASVTAIDDPTLQNAVNGVWNSFISV